MGTVPMGVSGATAYSCSCKRGHGPGLPQKTRGSLRTKGVAESDFAPVTAQMNGMLLTYRR
jgi:hypothetical protein